MLNLQMQNALQTIQNAVENARISGCEALDNDCLSCPFRHEGESGGVSCILGQIEILLEEIDENEEEDDE